MHDFSLAACLNGIFVSGSGTGVGKTVVTSAILRALLLDGIAAETVKPVQTGVSPDSVFSSQDSDARAYAAAIADLPNINQKKAHALRCFPLAASPSLAAAQAGTRLDVSSLIAALRLHKHNSSADFTLVEGAGGLRAPLNAREDMLDLMAGLGLPVLFVCGNQLGCLNHAILSASALLDRGLELAGFVLTDIEAARSDADALIFNDNEAMLRQRLPAGTPFTRLRHAQPCGGKAIRAMAARLAPLARELLRHSRAGSDKQDRSADLIKRDHAMLWHPYASATQPPQLYAACQSHDNRIVLEDGRELVDGMSSWWACIHGYNNTSLVNALKAQAALMPHVMFGGFTHLPAVGLAERLQEVLPRGLERIFFADSGSVAVEVALKMAFQYQQARGESGRRRFLALRGGYHGDTMGAMSVCDPVNGMHALFSGFMPGQFFLERPSCPFDREFTVSSLDNAREMFDRHGPEVAALILEPVVQGAGGMWFYHPQYLNEIANLCKEHGVLLIFDEIATGFGRTGKYFATEWTDCQPDILCCGKALTGGMLTLSATACTGEVADAICRGNGVFMHGPTFMANPLACAVAGASLDILAENRWRNQVAFLQAWMKAGLAPCMNREGVADVRVLGGIGVVEMESAVNSEMLISFFTRAGLWIRPFNRLIYLMPPYISPHEDVAKLCAAVCEAVATGVWRK